MKKEQKPMTPGAKFFFGRIFPLIFILIGAIVGYIGYNNIVLANASKSWDSVPGVITESSVVKSRSSTSSSSRSRSSATYSADIEYKFILDGRSYLGNRIAIGSGGSGSRSRANSVANSYPVGAEVSVYYMPGNPDQSVLETGIKLKTLIAPAVGIVFFISGIAMAIFLPKSYAKK